MRLRETSAFLLTLLFFTNPMAEEVTDSNRGFVQLEGASTFKSLSAKHPRDIENLHGGVYALTDETIGKRAVYGKLGASMLLHKKPRLLDANLEMAIGLRSRGKLSFFGGLGLMFSETIDCLRCTSQEEADNEQGKFGIFPEGGLRYDVTEKYRIGAYARQYNYFSCSTDSFYVFGLSLAMATE